MKQIFVITGTITYAIKGRDILRRKGCQAELKRSVNVSGNTGCGYGIITDCSLHEVESIFKQHGIKYLQIKDT